MDNEELLVHKLEANGLKVHRFINPMLCKIITNYIAII